MPNKQLQKAIEDEKALLTQRGAIAGDLETVKGQIAALDAGLGDAGADIIKLADELGSLENKRAALAKALELADKKVELAGNLRGKLQQEIDLEAAGDCFAKARALLEKNSKIAAQLKAMADDIQAYMTEGEKLYGRHRTHQNPLGAYRSQYFHLRDKVSDLNSAAKRIWPDA